MRIEKNSDDSTTITLEDFEEIDLFEDLAIIVADRNYNLLLELYGKERAEKIIEMADTLFLKV